MSTTRKSVSLASDVAEQAAAMAKADGRTVSNLVNKLLRDRFDKQATVRIKPRRKAQPRKVA